MNGRHRPFVIEAGADATPADPARAPPVPDALPSLPEAQAEPRRAGSRLLRAALWATGALAAYAVLVGAWRFVASLFAAEGALGWLALGLVALVGLLFAALILREVAGLARLRRLDRLRDDAGAAWDAGNPGAAREVVGQLRRLYAHRTETAWGLSRHAEAAAQLLDADAVLSHAEAEILGPLDARAVAEVEAAVRRVATITAIVPLAFADVAVALHSNLAMTRRIAAIYGGRAGTWASLRLLRKVFAALIAAGVASLADDLVGSVAGGGIVSKLSRRFGEGVVNGALTARVGIAAIELCRPLPFHARPRPGVSALVTRALRGLVAREGAPGAG